MCTYEHLFVLIRKLSCQNFLPEALPQLSRNPRASQSEREGDCEPCSQLMAEKRSGRSDVLLLILMALTHCGRLVLAPTALWTPPQSSGFLDAHLPGSAQWQAPHCTGVLKVKALGFSHSHSTVTGLVDASQWRGTCPGSVQGWEG